VFAPFIRRFRRLFSIRRLRRLTQIISWVGSLARESLCVCPFYPQIPQIIFYPQIPQINADYFLGGQFGV
jgi:hypothetical protein